MKITYIIQPRRTGKSHQAVIECLRDPQNSLIVYLNNRLRYLEAKTAPDVINTCILDEFLDSVQFHRYVRKKKVIFDEIGYIGSREELQILRRLNRSQIEEVVIYTSIGHQINRDLYEIAKELRRLGVSKEYSRKVLKSKLTQEDFEEFDTLFDSILTDPRTDLIHYYPEKKAFFLHCNKKVNVGEEVFQASLMNNIFKVNKSRRIFMLKYDEIF